MIISNETTIIKDSKPWVINYPKNIRKKIPPKTRKNSPKEMTTKACRQGAHFPKSSREIPKQIIQFRDGRGNQDEDQQQELPRENSESLVSFYIYSS